MSIPLLLYHLLHGLCSVKYIPASLLISGKHRIRDTRTGEGKNGARAESTNYCLTGADRKPLNP